ncbi:hypothetical protein GCM10007094_28260 [Pseudovibrio japonicus]|uniref:Uncharacterized protein n=1 Tax=Pseudovibrio japonicus TaxID=366534 RepID=A0ABQ3EJ09_9HYPH|nr:hypothetical protein GCM10007094_28260 [Pseudovibrio japonicus]
MNADLVILTIGQVFARVLSKLWEASGDGSEGIFCPKCKRPDNIAGHFASDSFCARLVNSRVSGPV